MKYRWGFFPTLGLLPEKKNSRIRKTPVFTHEIKMRQQILCRS